MTWPPMRHFSGMIVIFSDFRYLILLLAFLYTFACRCRWLLRRWRFIELADFRCRFLYRAPGYFIRIYCQPYASFYASRRRSGMQMPPATYMLAFRPPPLRLDEFDLCSILFFGGDPAKYWPSALRYNGFDGSTQYCTGQSGDDRPTPPARASPRAHLLSPAPYEARTECRIGGAAAFLDAAQFTAFK